jgi:hypothetical protein
VQGEVAPAGTTMGTQAMGDKKIVFWQKHSPNCDFYCRSTFLVITRWSDVRGKVARIG